MGSQPKQQEQEDYVRKPIFVPLPLDTSLGNPKNKRSDKTVNWIIAVVCLTLFIWFTTSKSFRDFTGLGIFITFCIYMTIGIVSGCLLISKFVYNVDEKVLERSTEGTSNHKMAINEVCGISAGGIHLEQFSEFLQGLVVNYQGCPALIYRLINGSTDGLPEGSDRRHYAGLQKQSDIVFTYGYEQLTLNLKFNTKNDKIWDYMSNQLNGVSEELGEDYTQMMAKIIGYQRDYTIKRSKVSATYRIIKLNYTSTIRDVVTLYNQIVAANYHTISDIELVQPAEFQILLCDYYGFEHIDLASLMPKGSFKEDIGDSRILATYDKKGIKKELNTVKNIDIIKEFYDNVYTDVYDLPEEDLAEIIDERDIFKD